MPRSMRSSSRATSCAPSRNARVLVLNLELCTLHFQETADLSQILCFLLFADGCAASVISAEPVGIALDSFKAVLLPNTSQLMSWNIRDFGFDMVLSGQVPMEIYRTLRTETQGILSARSPSSIDLCDDLPRRQLHSRHGRARFSTGAPVARRVARCAAPLRQYVLGHGHVRARRADALKRHRPARLCHVVWSGAHRGDDAFRMAA